MKAHLWHKFAVLAITGGTTLALFGGSAVHTTFSASQPGSLELPGAYVALTVDSGTFTCAAGGNISGPLLPYGPVGGLLPSPANTPVLADSCWSGPINLNNNGSVPETFTLTFGNLVVNNGGVDGDVLLNLNQAFIWGGWGAGAVIGTGNVFDPNWAPVPLSNYFDNTGAPVGGPILVESNVAAHTATDGSMTLSLEDIGSLINATGPNDENAWNGADVSIPFTITATAGA
jgi:hypothetical protein